MLPTPAAGSRAVLFTYATNCPTLCRTALQVVVVEAAALRIGAGSTASPGIPSISPVTFAADRVGLVPLSRWDAEWQAGGTAAAGRATLPARFGSFLEGECG